jgi:hypothetical protein
MGKIYRKKGMRKEREREGKRRGKMQRKRSLKG